MIEIETNLWISFDKSELDLFMEENILKADGIFLKKHSLWKFSGNLEVAIYTFNERKRKMNNLQKNLSTQTSIYTLYKLQHHCLLCLHFFSTINKKLNTKTIEKTFQLHVRATSTRLTLLTRINHKA